MRSVNFLVAGAVVALALSACSSSSKGASGPTTTVKPITTAEFCAQAKNKADAFDIAGIARKSSADLKREYSNSVDSLQQLAAQAPAEIHADMQTVVNVVKQLRAELADVDYDPSQLSLSAIPDLASPGTLSAGSHVASFFRDQCHFLSAQSGG